MPLRAPRRRTPSPGPDGLTVVGTQLFAGDVNSVKVIDQASKQIVKTITVGTANVRADESCYDAVHGSS
jgi:hypothetical protein